MLSFSNGLWFSSPNQVVPLVIKLQVFTISPALIWFPERLKRKTSPKEDLRRTHVKNVPAVFHE
jgi:hypothetical protein